MKTKFKKGNICWIEDYSNFGQSLILLEKRLTKNIEGGKIQPIWEAYLIANNHKGLMIFYTEDSINVVHLIFVSESKLYRIDQEI